MVASTTIKGRGRPREFDMDVALGKATQVFCERGYHATSIADLTDAMQLASGSVYKAFKDKRAVFLAVFDREAAVRGKKLARIISTAKQARDRIRDALIFGAEASHGLEGKRGCLVVGSAAELATFDAEIGQRVKSALHRSETLLVDLIRQGQVDGSVPAAVDGEATARVMLCLLQGMRVVGKTGRVRKDMTVVVDTAMRLLD
jgi:TetR/AcrR family transcriptional regulator, transcriptional repressor for nem operon